MRSLPFCILWVCLASVTNPALAQSAPETGLEALRAELAQMRQKSEENSVLRSEVEQLQTSLASFVQLQKRLDELEDALGTVAK